MQCSPKVPLEQRKTKLELRAGNIRLMLEVSATTAVQHFFYILQVSTKRVGVRQGKINDGEQVIKDIWKLVQEPWAQISYDLSHYGHNKCKRLYFDHPDLTIPKLFESFKEYYLMKMNEPLVMKYKTYHKFWRNCSPYSIWKPRTDVCDFCTKCKLLLKANTNHPCLTKYNLHLRKYERYKAIK